MKILIINGHPDEKSFSSAIFDAVVKNLDTDKHEIETLELAKMTFDPVLRLGYRQHMPEDLAIEKSQALIQWAEHFIFIYPIWWSSMPSLMTGWIERVFTPRLAYSANQKGHFLLNFMLGRQFKKLLTGKTADIIATSMAPSFWYRLFSGVISVPDSYGIASLKNAVLTHCGVKTKKIMILGNMGREVNTLQKRQNFLTKVSRYARKL
ncbi:NAD(P)H dehydrogenase (quinone) [Lactococcus hodotermopsidis]|uniref:NAD(P)H dehydrogenase (Quinone) n=1 Tax=Pseudolactococcus hodotermopsidis TaxID=2709157 RepID=A0A6A0B9P1_9LACT|nr:NAD(P)H-dependent oxidoreductase [Lactococcus hodotermopsidis]GFH42170.1 NAD(P)H dehydrogenase (quinone) [Lactococcus hodotermopsidis]